ncbi:hypothetical protein DT076_08725 [Desertihabitans brevis]|uniref:Coenzyme F420 hydrogenase n=2 Tax=Desertihabitans brevis TaxID=2268447 RepID=A0A367YYQ0_9ACTN|nr:hypothetical protein DT076_08725 [Desertihabitans brevis]
MALDEHGFLRPRRRPGTRPDPEDDRRAAALFRRSCPGVRVQRTEVRGARWHPTMGGYLEAWSAAATDPETRHRGSSGGVLTALSAWLAEQGVPAVVARADRPDPRRTVSVQITTREEALAAAGSRYNPVAAAAHPGATDPSGVVTGKPCEVAALRQLEQATGERGPLLLSFFCAGTPSQQATDRVLDRLGVEPGVPLRDLWFRGRGWPGRFTAVTADGQSPSLSYDESWGAVLGPAVQWRCKICPDGVGDLSDITAADFWEADEKGYPLFGEQDGRSALLARTPRGRDVVRAAVAAGVLTVAPLDVDALAGVQPFQRQRRSTLVGRGIGSRLAGRALPRYRGFGLWSLAVRRLRANVRAGRGTFRRVRASRREGRTGPA